MADPRIKPALQRSNATIHQIITVLKRTHYLEFRGTGTPYYLITLQIYSHQNITMANTDTWAISGVLCDWIIYKRMLKQQILLIFINGRLRENIYFTCQYIPNSMLVIRYVSWRKNDISSIIFMYTFCVHKYGACYPCDKSIWCHFDNLYIDWQNEWWLFISLVCLTIYKFYL